MKPTIQACAAMMLSTVFFSGVAAQTTEVPKIELPAACSQSGADISQHMSMGQDMTKQMQSGKMNEANMGYMNAMVGMHQPMMQGAMAPDPDVAFNCAMIAHHQGAIAMAKVQLQYGKDDGAKEMAQKTIDQQGKEIEEMAKWLEEHAKG